eukprot:TRINITY_DN11051_c0_g1_i1.p1 TRINITY_DN11051_c0_g1~~TRINITY_DN11051_c0_g1_i1.p1  ORF type:complete len:369 (-),score=134.03 TRINITY_DN11051_c0_g1_i1:41-1147(-)
MKATIWIALALTIACILCLSSATSASPGCLDESGNPVDWWVIFKFPILSKNSNPNLKGGYGYAYTDPKVVLAQSKIFLSNASAGALSYTLNQAYLSQVSELMYNDETPNGKNHESSGHLKGVISFDSKQGYWLVHSVPRFPNGPSNVTNYGGYPSMAAKYGQSFYCVNYGLPQLDQIASGLLIQKPYVYDARQIGDISSTMPNMAKLMQTLKSMDEDDDEIQTTTPPQTIVLQLESIGGSTNIAFFKNAEWAQDLYEYLVQPTLKLNMLWETWMNGDDTNKMPNFCTPLYKYDSINIAGINFSSEISWKETQDHSKWGMSMPDTDDSVICIGDINRQFSQSKRGGGTVCRIDEDLWADLHHMVSYTGC